MPTGGATRTAPTIVIGTATPSATAMSVQLHVTSGSATTYAVTISDSSLSLLEAGASLCGTLKVANSNRPLPVGE